MKLNRLAIAALGLLLSAVPARAQVPGAELNQVLVSREDLMALATRLDQTASSGSFSSEARARARLMADAVRRRLRDGDFNVGDRIFLQQFIGDSIMIDTLTIREGRVLVMPNIGDVSLLGVLRVELQDTLRSRMAQFIREPRIRAYSLVRISVMGAVQRQGWYVVPVDMTLDEVVNRAGGLATSANVNALRIERNTEILLAGEDAQRAFAEGRTVDALSLQAGDRIVVPELRQGNSLQTIQALQILLTIPLSIYAVIQLFRN